MIHVLWYHVFRVSFLMYDITSTVSKVVPFSCHIGHNSHHILISSPKQLKLHLQKDLLAFIMWLIWLPMFLQSPVKTVPELLFHILKLNNNQNLFEYLNLTSSPTPVQVLNHCYLWKIHSTWHNVIVALSYIIFFSCSLHLISYVQTVHCIWNHTPWLYAASDLISCECTLYLISHPLSVQWISGFVVWGCTVPDITSSVHYISVSIVWVSVVSRAM